MIIIQTNTPKLPGVYAIIHRESGRIYIGSSLNMHQRLMVHRSYLRKNKHQNIVLQNFYNKYSENAFDCECLELSDKQSLTFREQQWINKFGDKVLNITVRVERNELSKESIEKISKKLKERYKNGEIFPTRQTKTDVYSVFTRKKLYGLPSLKQAAKKTKVGVTTIIRIMKGDYAQSKGFVFVKKGVKPKFPKTILSNGRARDFDSIVVSKLFSELSTGNEILFRSNKEALEFFGVKNFGEKVTRSFKPVPLKSGELRESPKKGNTEPSQMKARKVIWKVQRIEIEDAN